MKLRKHFSLLALALVTILSIYGIPTADAMCMPSHPQSHYCNADYVVQLRVLRKSERLVPNKVVYKVQIKKSYKLSTEAHDMLKHGRIMTPGSEISTSIKLDVGKIYVVAGRVPELNACSYVKEYIKMSKFERRGFANVYRKGCGCEVQPCFGNQCLQKHNAIDSCKWSPWAKCETEHSVCMPATIRTPEGNIAQCRWRRTEAYKRCMHDP